MFVVGLLCVGNSEILWDVVLDGLGLVLLFDFSVVVVLCDGRLVEVLLDWCLVGFFGDVVYVIYFWVSMMLWLLCLLIDYLKLYLCGGFVFV